MLFFYEYGKKFSDRQDFFCGYDTFKMRIMLPNNNSSYIMFTIDNKNYLEYRFVKITQYRKTPLYTLMYFSDNKEKYFKSHRLFRSSIPENKYVKSYDNFRRPEFRLENDCFYINFKLCLRATEDELFVYSLQDGDQVAKLKFDNGKQILTMSIEGKDPEFFYETDNWLIANSFVCFYKNKNNEYISQKSPREYLQYIAFCFVDMEYDVSFLKKMDAS